MMAGPRFLSVGLMIRFVFCFSSLRALNCSGVRLDMFLFLYFFWSSSFSFLRDFSKRVIWSSISIEAGGGSQVLFFRYICGMYSEFSPVPAAFRKCLVLIY